MQALGELYGLLPAGDAAVTVSYGDGVFEDTQQEFSRRLQMLEKGVIDVAEMRRWYFGTADAAQ